MLVVGSTALPLSSTAPSLAAFAGLGRHAGVRPRMADEENLIARAGAGDTAAFRVLYERHRADVARLVVRMLSGRGDIDDVVQEVFVQVYRSLKDFRGQAKFSTWLHRVTVNVVLMHRRASRSRPVFADGPVPVSEVPRPDDVRPDEDAERLERMRAFSRVLDRLADKKRVVFVLHDLEGIAPSEIAKIVGAPVLTVRTRLFYARREIEAMLGDEPALAALALTFSSASSKGAGGAAPKTEKEEEGA
jgi:RNA polymerase sigma-70 factor (ECF subfamily)